MILSKYFNPKETLILYGYEKYFDFFKELIDKDKLPKVTMLTGEKGIGKSTFVNHLMHYYYDRKNYNQENLSICGNTIFHANFKNNTFPNIYFLNINNFKNIKVDDVRKLKQNLLKTSVINQSRFVILDDVETFNLSSLNALLKIIEEPSKNTHFILINNKSKSLIETIKSRSLEIKITFNNNQKIKILSSLILLFKQHELINKDLLSTSPGNFLRFNHMFNEKLNIENSLVNNIKIILNLYKKEKDIFFKELLIFVTEYYLQKYRLEKKYNNKKYIEKRSNLLKYINEFFLFNLNQNTLLSFFENGLYE
tara:strand:+ start:1754 stop:2683 length:930 start_codon:yes stop_codon:yes gene_type:complete